MIAKYFAAETQKLQGSCLTDLESREDWEKNKQVYRGQLLEMLGLKPQPERTPLEVKVTGRTEEAEFYVENIHFQSRPGLYVTGNVYVPKKVDGRLPAILYVCGHGGVKKDGVSFGNKVHYHHHGSWFARNGYICLTIDTLQLGEIEGIHHGTYSHDMWWWLNRGYTPAGVEAWNCVRALDYLQSRDDVDGERLGVTGRSGGGAYSWWIAAIDERIKVAVPVAGITDMKNHVVDGCVEGHCDCMFMVNTYQWDYAKVAALVAPRPLLISNTDDDGIFPLDGVVSTYNKVRQVYKLYGAEKNVGLHITSGPHKDTQELRVHAFRWFNHYLKNDDDLINTSAGKYFEPQQLRVFETLPKDEKNTSIHESFVAASEPATAPEDEKQLQQFASARLSSLQELSFRAWPKDPAALNVKPAFSAKKDGLSLNAYDFTSQENVDLRLYVVKKAGLEKPQLMVLNVLDEQSWKETLSTLSVSFKEQLASETLPPVNSEDFKSLRGMLMSQPWAMAYVAPRGIGPTAWDQSAKKQTQHRRRFYLLGQTLDGMRVWDTRRAIQALRAVETSSETQLWLQSERRMAGVTLLASLFEPAVTRMDLYKLPHTLRDGPFLLNARRFLDTPEIVTMAMARSRVVLYDNAAEAWKQPSQTAKNLQLDKKQFQIRQLPGEPIAR
jgi:cephalosporin-C deacetylase-like acetyl esterase